MNIYTSSELATKTRAVCDDVKQQGCAFVTNNGKAEIMMIDLSGFDSLNDAVHSYDQWVGQRALEALWRQSDSQPMTLAEIDEEISSVRAKRP
ncbi:MAG: hypothetical protein V8R08_04855 [Coriobacteriales bacterium]